MLRCQLHRLCVQNVEIKRDILSRGRHDLRIKHRPYFILVVNANINGQRIDSARSGASQEETAINEQLDNYDTESRPTVR